MMKKVIVVPVFAAVQMVVTSAVASSPTQEASYQIHWEGPPGCSDGGAVKAQIGEKLKDVSSDSISSQPSREIRIKVRETRGVWKGDIYALGALTGPWKIGPKPSCERIQDEASTTISVWLSSAPPPLPPPPPVAPQPQEKSEEPQPANERPPPPPPPPPPPRATPKKYDMGFGASVILMRGGPQFGAYLDAYPYLGLGVRFHYAKAAMANGEYAAEVQQHLTFGPQVEPLAFLEGRRSIEAIDPYLRRMLTSIALNIGGFVEQPRERSFGDARGVEFGTKLEVPLWLNAGIGLNVGFGLRVHTGERVQASRDVGQNNRFDPDSNVLFGFLWRPFRMQQMPRSQTVGVRRDCNAAGAIMPFPLACRF